MITRRHDRELLDALEEIGSKQFDKFVWRVVRDGREPLQGYPAGGRWDPRGEFEVLYTSLEPTGALVEVHYHLSRAPVFPSMARYKLHQISARAEKVLHLDIQSLEFLGVEKAHYASSNYERTQAIGAAAYFLGFDGILVPSARTDGSNLVLFLDRIDPGNLEVLKSEDVDWTRIKSR